MTEYEIKIRTLSPTIIKADSPRSVIARYIEDPESVALFEHDDGWTSIWRVQPGFTGGMVAVHVGNIRKVDEE